MSNMQSDRQQKAISVIRHPSPDPIDFDLWARQVKRQMIDCLRKRGSA